MASRHTSTSLLVVGLGVLVLGTALAVHRGLVVDCGATAATVGGPSPADARGSDAVVSPESRVRHSPAAESPPAPPGPIRFTDVTRQTGVGFRHETGTSPERPFPAANGSGIAAFDYDLDGRIDLYFLTGTSFPLDPARIEPVNRCYRSLGGWQFMDVTADCGLAHNGYSAGVAVGDYDNDGFPDAYVNCYGPNRLYHNQGDGTFVEVAATAGVDDDRWGTSAAFLDYNRDGLLDLYVCNYAQWTLETNPFCGDRVRNIRQYCGPRTVPPEQDAFFRNGGDGTFQDCAADTGLAVEPGRAQGVVAADLNDDGWIDLYVGNDLNPNFLFLNEQGVRFRDVSESSGAAYSYAGVSQAGMGVDAADVDRDGRIELFVTNYEREHNTLYQNLGGALFHDVSETAGLAADSLRWVGWGTAFADFDLDGWFDLIVTNGHTDDNFNAFGIDSPYEHPPLVWRNSGGRFRLLEEGVGAYFHRPHVGRALALADLDDDGDLDVVIGHQDEAPALLRNDRLPADPPEAPFVQLRLVGRDSNRDAIGSRIGLRSDGCDMSQQIKGGGSYLSAHDLRQVLAVVNGQEDLTIEVHWPNGRHSVLTDVARGRCSTIVEPHALSSSPLIVSDPVGP